MTNRIRASVAAGCALALLPSCTMRRIVADSMVGLLEEVETAYLDEPSYRYGREAAAALLKMLDGVIASSPGNEDLLALGARLNAQYALGFIEAEDGAYARSLYRKAMGYGLRALDDPELEKALAGSPVLLSAALRRRDGDDVPLLFWTGLAYGGWINLNKDSVRALADLPNAVAFMDRVIELDERFFHGGAWLFKAKFHGSRAKDLGGSPEKAGECARRALEVSGGRLLLAKVYLARFHAVPVQDEDLFRRTLKEVLEAPDDILPGESLVTAIAKHEAERLLEEEEDLFVGP